MVVVMVMALSNVEYGTDVDRKDTLDGAVVQ
jgi:hypothetical protein